ncbi:MAG: hypothetical protein ACK4N5_11520 [Myxococcales bacterium]
MRRKNDSRLTSDAPRRPATQRAREPTRAALQARVAQLEDRVAALEKLLAQSRPPAAARNEAREVRKEPDTSPRCPGCHLRVPSVARGRCQWCGFVFDAFHEIRKLGRSG